MNSFIYEYPVKNYFGVGAVASNLSAELEKVGPTVMLAYGGGSIKRNGIYDEVTAILKAAGKTIVEFSGIMSNPTYDKVQEGAKLAKEKNVDFILAVGGGSVSDCCKVVASQVKTEKDIWEMIMTEHTLPTEALPLGVIVTAAGTGSEQNEVTVITNTNKKIKAGMFCTTADFAILDPKYTLTVPMKQVISGAFDTLSHAMETYFGKPDSLNLSDEISEAVMRNVIRNMKVLITDADNLEARSELLWAAAMAENGILKIGKITDFQAHQIEHQLAVYTDCNHGQGLAVIHPVLYRHIYESGLERFTRFAKCIWDVDTKDKTEKEIALAGIEALASFIDEMGLPKTLREMGITDSSCFRAVAESTNIKEGCCKQLSSNEIYDILMEAM